MKDPKLWFILAGLFVIVGAINIARARHLPDARSPVRLILGLSAFLWAAATLCFRFAGTGAFYCVAAVAGLSMLSAALASIRNIKQ